MHLKPLDARGPRPRLGPHRTYLSLAMAAASLDWAPVAPAGSMSHPWASRPVCGYTVTDKGRSRWPRLCLPVWPGATREGPARAALRRPLGRAQQAPPDRGRHPAGCTVERGPPPGAEPRAGLPCTGWGRAARAAHTAAARWPLPWTASEEQVGVAGWRGSEGHLWAALSSWAVTPKQHSTPGQ